MADTIMTSRPVSPEDAARIVLGQMPAPDMITVEQYEREYGHKPSMTINVSEAARNLADHIDREIADKIYAELSKP